jgi:hypothetical protein
MNRALRQRRSTAKRIQSCAQHHVLPNTRSSHRSLQRIFREAAPRAQERPHPARERLCALHLFTLPQLGKCARRQHPQRQRIGEDQRRLIVKLVRGTPHRNQFCCSTTSSFLHDGIPPDLRRTVKSPHLRSSFL